MENCSDGVYYSQVVDETKYMKKVKSDHMKQLQQLCVKLDEHSVEELNQLQSFEDEIRSYKVAFLSADDKRKASFQLAYDEDQQIVTVSFTVGFWSAI
jgi:hypothetical protein